MTLKEPIKTVVITGGATGIGFEVAKKLVKSNRYRVALIGKDASKLEEAQAALLGEFSGDSSKARNLVTTFHADLSQSSSTKKVFERVLQTHNQIYGLVNNAGVYPFGGITNTSESQWDEVMNLNLKAYFLSAQALVPVLSKNPGGARIVNVSSTAGILPNHFALAYSVSKAAVIQLTKTLAKELGKDGITVNCVCPGIVRSPMHENYHASKRELQDFYARRGSAFPMGRVGEPEDIASVIQFFLSEEASWVTGDVFVADGGRLLL